VPPFFPVTLALYAVSSTLYLAHLVTARAAGPQANAAGGDKLARGARIVLGLAFLSHAVDIGWLGVHRIHPGSNAREAVSFAAWLTCGIYLGLSFRSRIPIVGTLVVPTTLVLDVAARLSPVTESRPTGSVLGAVHITLALVGVALFLVAAGGSTVYLFVERRLKAHKGKLVRGGPSLEALDRINWRCIVVGFPLFTIAMITGALWAARIPGVGVFTPQYAIAAVAWLLYAGLLLMRVTAGLRGRRAAIMTLAGAATATTVLLIYFVRGVTGA
jgi:ABC-type uncharacterized transport system permease subunit